VEFHVHINASLLAVGAVVSERNMEEWSTNSLCF
jgi:hypothetical protein